MRNNRYIRRSHLNASVSRTDDILDDYRRSIAKEVAQATKQIINQYRNDLDRDYRTGEVQLYAEGDNYLLKYDRAIDVAEDDLADAIFLFVVEAVTYSQN